MMVCTEEMGMGCGTTKHREKKEVLKCVGSY
jgi:hypothetical protein